MSIKVCKFWPLAGTRQRRIQAIRLLKARQYLQSRGIAANVVGSTFEYSQSPKVLKCSV